MRGLWLAVCCWSTLAALAPGARADAVDDYLQAQMARNHIPGLAVAVVRKGKVVKLKGYGLANLEWEQPVRPDTAFQLASSTKPFTGALLLRLAEEGKLALDDSVLRFLPDAPAAWAPITLRHLATHSSGIRDDLGAGREATLEQAVAAAAKLPLAHPPGAQAGYGIGGYIVLRQALEKAAGQPFPELLRTRVTDPLGLTSTRFDFATAADPRSAALVPRRAGVYEWDEGAFRNFSFPFGQNGYAAGGLYSSAADLARLLAALDGANFLSAASRAEMWRQAPLDDGSLNGFGVGWAVKVDQGRRSVGHSGGPALSDLLLFPEERLGIAVLTNAQRLYPYLAQGVADLLLPGPPAEAAKGIEDAQPALTARLQALLADAGRERVDAAQFAAQAQKVFVPSLKPFLFPFLRSLEPLGRFVLVEERKTPEGLRRRYQGLHGRKAVLWQFDVTPDGKVLGFGPK